MKSRTKKIILSCLAGGFLLLVLVICVMFESYVDSVGQKIYKLGNLVRVRLYLLDGKVSSLETRIGEWNHDRFYWENGVLAMKKEGNIRMMSIKRYYKDGKVLCTYRAYEEERDGRETYYYPNGNIMSETDYTFTRDCPSYLAGDIITRTSNGKIFTSGKYKKGNPVEGTFLSCRDDVPAWIPLSCHDKYILHYKNGELAKVEESKGVFYAQYPPEAREIPLRYRCITKEESEDIEKYRLEMEALRKEEKEKNRPKFPWDKDDDEGKTDNKK